MARYINGCGCHKNCVITEDHEGIQIRTQWDTGIKSCQMAVQIKIFSIVLFIAFIVLHIIKIKYIMYNVQVYLGSL